ncbi:hypothetical protein D7Y13_07365 [Corallococcus praedator]|uniref:Lipoprotein n=1 Tax=Corallococcus praedator TaxID=2316724 RepID=A0ABX9QMF4_9BACT|nr:MULTISPECIES: hypothetical protein [Corallococcus]RKH18448.1 hypothetical protein D7X74_09440 [Corallococcus sp. CA047B]RKH33003.1 hypothetical protein D7X75_13775 [Corallococcus sp. CA031C]RKI13524.1 hypothetical protein D7Y13_07365 [Corallococcus praedator]
MLRIAVAAFVLAVTGCASTSSGAAAGGRGGNATVTGSITYPESGLQGDPCSSVNVKVTEGNSAALGSGEVKQSRKNTCSYTVASLPDGADLKVELVVDPALKCASGAAPTASPEPTTVNVARFGAKVLSYKLSCG